MSSPVCRCGQTQFPKPLAITAGLTEELFRTARALGSFADWRESVLTTIGRKPALDAWRARDAQDLGLMLAEMGAYIADVVSFYDALIANETYLLTATLPGTRRRLVRLLGYRPRPAAASKVLLAAHADGVKLVTLPSGTSFRSAQFLDATLGKQAPQVFELTQPATIDPRVNRLAVAQVRATTLDSATIDQNNPLLVESGSVRLKPGDPVVLSFAGALRAAHVESVSTSASLRHGVRAVELCFKESINRPPGATYAGLRVLAPGNATSLWQHGANGSDKKSAIDGGDLLTGSQVALRVGEVLLLEKGDDLKACYASAVSSVQRVLLTSQSTQVTDIENNKKYNLSSPEIYVTISQVTIDRDLGWLNPDVSKITLYYALTDAARVIEPIKYILEQGDKVTLPDLIDAPRTAVGRMLLEDAHQNGVEAHGALDAVSHSATFNMTPPWGTSLTSPIQLLGNVVCASRGETVSAELLGVGAASRSSQTFKLRKKPLTYLNAANADGLASTLSVRVGGVLWREVPSFYRRSSTEPVFIVRHDDADETYITMGGAARVPTGARITADYRYGAGAAQSPAGAVTQLAKPVAGLKQVHNVLPAFGGADTESPTEIAARAPRSALLLGRAVSLLDLEAATASVAGVRSVRAAWRWDAAGMRPAAVIRYIGDTQLSSLIRAKLRDQSEPDAAIMVERAQPQSASLELQLLVDPRHDPADVTGRAMVCLYAAPTFPGSGGILRAERLGPDGIIYLSHIIAAVMKIDGVVGVQSVSFNGASFVDVCRIPPDGLYWEFGEPGMAGFSMTINGAK